MPVRYNLIGQTFGSLRVLGLGEPNGKKRRWVCLCSCGRTTLSGTADLTGGKATKCRRCSNKKHGATSMYHPPTPTYRSWFSMRQRCNNPNATAYHRYGGRGISVCDRWNTYENFLADMGERPSLNHSIDRLDGNEDYTPENCRWATRQEQTAVGRRFANPKAWENRHRDEVTGRWSGDS